MSGAVAFAEEAEANATKIVKEKTAKEKEAERKAALEASEIEVITIGGMRSSEIAAINMKKFATSISDNLSAEAIGALPGPSIAESLERLAGVSGNQNNGRSDKVSVRGLGGEYTLTTLNGRQLVAAWRLVKRRCAWACWRRGYRSREDAPRALLG